MSNFSINDYCNAIGSANLNPILIDNEAHTCIKYNLTATDGTKIFDIEFTEFNYKKTATLPDIISFFYDISVEMKLYEEDVRDMIFNRIIKKSTNGFWNNCIDSLDRISTGVAYKGFLSKIYRIIENHKSILRNITDTKNNISWCICAVGWCIHQGFRYATSNREIEQFLNHDRLINCGKEYLNVRFIPIIRSNGYVFEVKV